MGNFISSYTGTKAGTAWREKAQKYNDERAACFQKSQHYFSKGDHEAAKKWSNAGKALGQKMEDANQRAAKVIFDDLNAPGKQPDRTYDFHGLFVKEALHKLEDIVQLAEKKKWTDITIIVGRGTHSINGIAKLPSAVEDFAQSHSDAIASYQLDRPTKGCIYLELSSSGSSSMCIIQ